MASGGGSLHPVSDAQPPEAAPPCIPAPKQPPAYQQVMKHTLEMQEHLTLRQAEAVALRTENGRVTGVVLRTGAVYRVRAVVLCTGTYLRGRTIVGDCVEESGPTGFTPPTSDGEPAGPGPASLRRFKTGTPPRVNRRSIDFSQMQLQEGAPLPALQLRDPGRRKTGRCAG